MTKDKNAKKGITVCIDRGGTFTDCIGFIPNHIHPPDVTNLPMDGMRSVVVKLLSVDPANYPDAPREGIRRILELATGIPHPRHAPLDTSRLDLIRMGTTVATNALLERKGAKSLFVTTKGFRDVLHIGNQARPLIFDLSISKPDVLYDQVIEVDERVTLVGYTSTKAGQSMIVSENDPSYVRGKTGEWIQIIRKPDLSLLEPQLRQAKEEGFESVAICFVHSFSYPDHELQVQKLCENIGFKTIAVSSLITPMIKLVSRGTSASVDAYLTPSIQKYLQGFFSGFDSGIENVRVEFMQSDGGLVPVSKFNGFRAILSGPAGGVVGYAMTSWKKGGKAVIGFDMGGTSTDVSRFAGTYDQVFEATTAGVTMQAPQLDIQTVAAGGGSRLFFREGLFVVGPESASADPGPVCYRKGGYLAITDANLLLGRLVPDLFPKIFGPKEQDPLDINATREAFCQMSSEIGRFLSTSAKKDSVFSNMTLDEIAYGFIKVANESMCRPIRALTEGKGFKASDHLLSCFGGAGGQHAFAIARSLGIKTILIHKHAAILSAYGLALANVVQEAQEPSSHVLSDSSLPFLQTRLAHLQQKVKSDLLALDFDESTISYQYYLNLRYVGTDNAMMTEKPVEDEDWDFGRIFSDRYKQEFGFHCPEKEMIVDDIRVCGTATTFPGANGELSVYSELESLPKVHVNPQTANRHEPVYWEHTGRVSTPVYLLQELPPGGEVQGPALIVDATSTVAVEPACSAVITSEHIVGFVNSLHESAKPKIGTEMDPILLSVFGHRFMGIAEQMGRTLQKTSVSTNIKERLDFSCALFGPDGGLVANAPHIPVHLGSMQEAVRWQMKYGPVLKPGDVIVTNHPSAGGSHLPDITVITPVFEFDEIVFFVASRGHHADIGGIQPGSMPPSSKELYEEGAAIKSFLLVENGRFNEEGITKILRIDPAQYEGCSGTRCLQDNLSDLKAQVAANQKGITLVTGLIKEYSLEVVHAFMGYIQQNAELAVRTLLKKVAALKGTSLHAVDYMDDGSPIELAVTIDGSQGSAQFDFSGTGTEVYGNTNAPKSVTYSAIIYCLRCLVDIDIPLNQGALSPIIVKIPESSLLNPSETAAVVGGNVMTSQRLCDVILKAFEACAASQGCCNNLTFGKGGQSLDGHVEEGFGFYETIGGGSGAGPSWHGRSGVHVHMTNTRITDVEIMERRYPVLIREFGLRRGSGGRGNYSGGDGIIRDIEFKETLEVSILSERRVYQPYGLAGGEAGKTGQNILIKKLASGHERIINFGGKNQTVVHPGDRLRIETPGGGGWGSPST